MLYELRFADADCYDTAKRFAKKIPLMLRNKSFRNDAPGGPAWGFFDEYHMMVIDAKGHDALVMVWIDLLQLGSMFVLKMPTKAEVKK